MRETGYALTLGRNGNHPKQKVGEDTFEQKGQVSGYQAAEIGSSDMQF